MRKFMTVLLTLALCLSLAAPALAAGEEAAPAPGEQTEPLAVETETPASEQTETQPAEDVTEPDEEAPPEDVAEPDEEAPTEAEPPTLADLIAAEGVVSEDGTYVMLGRQYGHLHDDEVRDFAAEAAEILQNSEIEEGYIALRAVYGHLCFDRSCPYNAAAAEKTESASAAAQFGPGVCPYCGEEDWTFWKETEHKIISVDKNYHTESYYIVYLCNTTGCGGYCRTPMYRVPYEPHSWTKTATGNYTNNGSDHAAEYTYTCTVCGHTKTETETEEHSMEQVSYTGRNYHRGTLHYLEYQCICKACRYSRTEYLSQPCPGRNDGTGCVFFVNKVDPPGEVQDVTVPEETAPPEDVTEPDEEAPPEDATVPDEEAPPEDVTEPGEAVPPGDVTIPEETTPPGDMTEPEETAPPTDAANPKGPTPLPAEETQEYNRYQAGKAIELYTGDPMAMKSANNIADGNTMAIVPDHDHVKVYTKLLKFWYEISREQHKYCEQYETRCIYCESDGTSNEYGDWEPHSWTKTATGNYTNNGSDHAAEYTYTCTVCGYTKTEPESEEHSYLSKPTVSYQSNGSTHTATYTYTCVCDATKTETEEHGQENAGYSGSNYHSGRFHYVGYRYVCKEKCGYTTITYEPTPCPGRNDGTGCVFFVNKVDPPVEVQDVTVPEETAPPEDVTEPDEEAPPEDATVPDEEVPPEDVAEPGEAVPPGDGEAPGETAPPGDEASPGEADPPGGVT